MRSFENGSGSALSCRADGVSYGSGLCCFSAEHLNKYEGSGFVQTTNKVLKQIIKK